MLNPNKLNTQARAGLICPRHACLTDFMHLKQERFSIKNDGKIQKNKTIFLKSFMLSKKQAEIAKGLLMNGHRWRKFINN